MTTKPARPTIPTATKDGSGEATQRTCCSLLPRVVVLQRELFQAANREQAKDPHKRNYSDRGFGTFEKGGKGRHVNHE